MTLKFDKKIHANYGTDKNLESGQGVTIDYPDFSFTIHRAGGSNKKFATVLSEKMKPFRQRYERGLLDDETSEKILLEAFVEGVVVDWSIKDADGKKIPFNVANVLEFFRQFPDVYADLKAQAMDAATFRAANEEIESKN